MQFLLNCGCFFRAQCCPLRTGDVGFLFNGQDLLSVMNVICQPPHNFLKSILLFRLKVAQP